MAQLNGSSEMGTQQNPANSSAGDSQQQREPQQGTQQPTGSGAKGEEPRRVSLAELFADEGGDEGSDDESSQSGNPAEPVDSIDGLVKRHKMTPEQVYAIKIPMPNGAEPVTLGELKDRVGELVDLETRETQFDQRRIKSEGDLLRAQAEIRELMALMPKEHLSPAAVEKVRQKHERTMEAERRATLEHIPEWNDSKRRVADITGMFDLLSNYGFDENFLNSVVDHRALKFIRDSYLRDKRIKEALAKVKDVRRPGQRPSGKGAKGAIRPSGTSQRKGGAVPDQQTRLETLFNNAEGK